MYNHISPPNFANVTGLGETSDIIIQYIQWMWNKFVKTLSFVLEICRWRIVGMI